MLVEQRIFCPNTAVERNIWQTSEVKHSQVRRISFHNTLSELERLGVCLKTPCAQSFFFIYSPIYFAVTDKIQVSRYCIALSSSANK